MQSRCAINYCHRMFGTDIRSEFALKSFDLGSARKKIRSESPDNCFDVAFVDGLASVGKHQMTPTFAAFCRIQP